MPRSHNGRMRLIWTLIAVLALYIVDRMFLDGQIADLAWSLLHWVGTSINHQVDDLLRPLRR
jgi:hypothetical protein